MATAPTPAKPNTYIPRLTAKQQQFAKLVANGMSQSMAYDQAYRNKGRNHATQVTTASRTANRPHVKAEIQRVADQLCPVGEMRQVRERMLSNMQYLAMEARDERVRLAATKMLHDIADERLQREQSLRTVNLDRLIDDIRELEPAPAPKAALELEAADADPETDADPDPVDHAAGDAADQ